MIRANKTGPWYFGHVTRPDAGGTLYNAVRADGREHCGTPSYDLEAVRARVDRLNRAARRRRERSS